MEGLIKIKRTKISMEQKVGVIFKYFDKIGVAAIKLNKTLKEGDKIRIKGNATDFEMIADSMQMDNQKIKTAKKGDSIGIKTPQKVRENDEVFKI